jgi:hypothetical protein
VITPREIKEVLFGLFKKSYWNKTNTIEFFAFSSKLVIIIPGLIFGLQWWWLYVIALVSSLALILTSTVKTLPTIIYFNIVWVGLAICGIVLNFN